MEEKIKPCPFCGSIALIVTIGGYHPFIYTVECSNCFATIGTKHAIKQDAIDKWNKQKPSEPPTNEERDFELWKEASENMIILIDKETGGNLKELDFTDEIEQSFDEYMAKRGGK
jgi:transcription elongation factor Elf1